jgi:2-amino-4-hydroxy-6-hydroxymethyldihydropteridine diphosphokinase
MNTTAYIGIGSNLQNPSAQVSKAIESLGKQPDCHIKTVSKHYLNKAFGPVAQPDCINAVIQIETSLSPERLLTMLQNIELLQGRVREMRWGPRVIDLDLLLYGNIQLESDKLTIPHPGLTERYFVLVPLFEIAPDLVLPDGRPLATLMTAVDHSVIWAVDA